MVADHVVYGTNLDETRELQLDLEKLQPLDLEPKWTNKVPRDFTFPPLRCTKKKLPKIHDHTKPHR